MLGENEVSGFGFWVSGAWLNQKPETRNPKP